jgi:hypothetical protein
MQKQEGSTDDNPVQRTYLRLNEAESDYKLPLLTTDYLTKNKLW